jgi:hypothetical protein
MYLNLGAYEIAQSSFVNDGQASLSGNVAYVCAQGTTHAYSATSNRRGDIPVWVHASHRITRQRFAERQRYVRLAQ